MVFRFTLSDREFASAWLREFYRRPGWRIARVLFGPFLIGAGVLMMGSQNRFTWAMGIASIALGAYRTLKPFLMAAAIVAQRKKIGAAQRQIEVKLDREGMSVTDGKTKTLIGWEKIRSSGLTESYAWIEMKDGKRATIPKRAIDDVEALRKLLGRHTTVA
jgi:hypothetical protein